MSSVNDCLIKPVFKMSVASLARQGHRPRRAAARVAGRVRPDAGRPGPAGRGHGRDHHSPLANEIFTVLPLIIFTRALLKFLFLFKLLVFTTHEITIDNNRALRK